MEHALVTTDHPAPDGSVVEGKAEADGPAGEQASEIDAEHAAHPAEGTTEPLTVDGALPPRTEIRASMSGAGESTISKHSDRSASIPRVPSSTQSAQPVSTRSRVSVGDHVLSDKDSYMRATTVGIGLGEGGGDTPYGFTGVWRMDK